MHSPYGPVHTPGNAVPNIDDTELGRALDSLHGVHPGLTLVADGLRHIAHDRHHITRIPTILNALAGDPHGHSLIDVIGHLVARLTDADQTPTLRQLNLDEQKTVQQLGEESLYQLTDMDLQKPAAEAAVVLDEIESKST
ncbi:MULTISPECIES: hypothetical protein [unclassified Streptomyces]|uniref:hypothetical protein n=1 Tax=unclassified Streptomyces TaxID=2593676 RepID=UPI00081B81E6|nr:hypothetical protein [Streptomyces sp. BvitLS-983]MYX88454.1 hypothetical protein [Streptomyces sp. SID4915]SCE16913.1 hypothetical protein GA0115250_144785 [Streptomyces sp. BvitLS-983]